MKTAPLDKEPPFVLAPLRETLWQRLIGRAIGLFNGLRKQKRGIDRVTQSQSALNIGSQVSSHDLLGRNYTANQGGVWSAQSNSYQTVDVAQSGSFLKIYEGSMDAVNDGHSGILGQGLNAGCLAHDGSYKFFKWDNAEGCMVPYEPSSPSRFRRACGAFMREWRRK